MTTPRGPRRGAGARHAGPGIVGHVDQTFPNEPASVPAARHLAADMLAGAPDSTVETVALVVSELATNCVVHAGSGFTMTVDCTPARVLVEVTDTGAGTPAMRSPGPTDPSGRGLRIVDALSSRWGVRQGRGGHGHTVWFTVRLAPSAPVRPRASGRGRIR